MRQSFKPGEIDPQTANQIGYELALEFTKGKHAFVVATHTDKAHIHNHVIFNAFNLECDGKFHDPWYSGRRDVVRISDAICREYGLSVIEVKHGWRDPYNEWEQKQGIEKEDKPPTARAQLEEIIALCLEKQPKDFNHLLKYLEDYSCIAKRRGKNISITTPFSKNPIRLSSLSEQFTEDGIKEQVAEQQNYSQDITHDTSANIETETAETIETTKTVDDEIALYAGKSAKPKNTENIKDRTSTFEILKSKPKNITKPSELRLIIDIQNSLKATENIGYKKWAEKFNIEQMSQTLLFIERHQLTLGELENMATQKPKTLANIKGEIESADIQLQRISTLQRHIGTYGKTKEVYRQYKQSKTPEQFRAENSKAISDHELARAYFDECGYGFGSGNRLPSIKELREQYATHNAEKKSLWAKYHDIRNSDKDIDNAWQNVRTLLNLKETTAISAPEIAPNVSKSETSKGETATPTKRNAPNL